MNRYEQEIAVVRMSAPYGLINQRTTPGFVLADGTVLLESEKDAYGRYIGGTGMDGMYSRTGKLYCPVIGNDGNIRAFRETKPENYLATAEVGAEQNYNQIDGIINNETPPSLRDDLRRCQEESTRTASTEARSYREEAR